MSAHVNEAIKAYERGVIDFVPKPFSRERLAQALERVRTRREDDCTRPPTRFLAVRKPGRIQLVNLAEVMYIEGADHYSELILTNGSRELHDKSLERLLAILPGDFVRIHKRFLVRLSSIAALHTATGTHHEAELRSGCRLPVGRSRYKLLHNQLIK